MNILKNERGFTLIELVLIIVILGILGAVATVQFGSIMSDSNKAALDGAAGPYNAQLALAVNTLKHVPLCTNAEFGTEVYSKVSISGGKVTPNKTDCGATPGTTNVALTISATCKDVWDYDDGAGSFVRNGGTSDRSGC
jgi:prepilin-type N-terminal cleavage/methylation domain-containing protein